MVTTWLINPMLLTIEKTYLFLPITKNVGEAVKETCSDGERLLIIFRVKNSIMANEVRRNGCYQILHGHVGSLARIWPRLWDVVPAITPVIEKNETKRVFELLTGLPQELDDVRERILSRRPLYSICEAFTEVRWEKSDESWLRVALATTVLETTLIFLAIAPLVKSLP